MRSQKSRIAIVGLGTQGKKRKPLIAKNFAFAVDPIVDDAEYTDIRQVPLDEYDCAFCCLPDSQKSETVSYLVENQKDVLVEKPIRFESVDHIQSLELLANDHGSYVYTAYNHRFEPHIRRMKDVIASGELGRLYSIKIFYGNGTARLVRDSTWRDSGSALLWDLGSHIYDIITYVFGFIPVGYDNCTFKCYENKTPDLLRISHSQGEINLLIEASYLCWKNHFSLEVFAENGSAHISSLCKWGPARFTLRKRVLPSGVPTEETVEITCPDPTWDLEHAHFLEGCSNKRKTDLSNDVNIARLLECLENST